MLHVKWMKSILPGVLMALVFVSSASAALKTRVITLKDGTTVQGQIVAIDNGSYIVESPALGRLSIKIPEVASIDFPAEAAEPEPAAQAPAADDLQALQAQIMADPEVMADIQALASDREILTLMSDPAFAEAAQARDMAAIQANPKTAQLMNNPKIKALIEKIQSSSLKK